MFEASLVPRSADVEVAMLVYLFSARTHIGTSGMRNRTCLEVAPICHELASVCAYISMLVLRSFNIPSHVDR